MFQKRTFNIRVQRGIYEDNEGTSLPHFYVIDREGTEWHFLYDELMLPGILSPIWFKGSIYTINKKRKQFKFKKV